MLRYVIFVSMYWPKKELFPTWIQSKNYDKYFRLEEKEILVMFRQIDNDKYFIYIGKKSRNLSQNITINVSLFKKLRDIIFFWWDNHFMSHFEGHFEGAKTFFNPLNLGVKNVEAPSKCPANAPLYTCP